MNNLTFGFIGLGLIGGSVARHLKKLDRGYTLIAYNRSINSLNEAKKDGIIDIICTEINDEFSKCDYIFLCTPVEYNAIYLAKLKPIIKDTCLITDVGSVKTHIHNEVIRLGLESNFIGGHPMAGSEKTGYINSSDHLLENAYYAITPTAKSTPDKVEEYRQLVSDMGALPIVIDYKEHDYVVASISHLPHVIASCLVATIKHSDNKQETMKLLAAGGFKDITRIASSSPEMWQQICLTNTDNIVKVLDNFSNNLNSFKNIIANREEQSIYERFEESRDYRNSINDNKRGPIDKTYFLYCDIIDEEGAIATIATILATNHISIKNIGIVHNREFEEAVLRIEFYDSDSVLLAKEVLIRHKYTIY
ncbi:prephenate dehydrogenase [Falcatimonas sp. MSJ-15]|uniref:prephenate dehydrogenase n=1 Tax=Falcatimonas sp. MSJ-15 TaxID=2841515 RepID=UPI001C128D71|nr:prephenate dehydrogenase [Falcatimonas sp. MSJ-15]MBU5468817.1 prephenate dehydrogenase [Falcatimonas sp. MSJ-15]